MICTKARSSHQRCSVKQGVLRNFAKFTGKHLCQGHFLNKVTGAIHKNFRAKILIRVIHKRFHAKILIKVSFMKVLF